MGLVIKMKICILCHIYVPLCDFEELFYFIVITCKQAGYADTKCELYSRDPTKKNIIQKQKVFLCVTLISMFQNLE